MQKLYKLTQCAAQHEHDMPNITHADLMSWYNPLDFFSGDAQRVERAVGALYTDWTHNTGHMQMFIDGILTPYDSAHVRFPWLDQFTTAREHLTKAITQTLLEPMNQTVLLSLVQQQQRLDPYDIEGIAQLWESLEGEPLSEAQFNDFPPITLSEYEWVAQHSVPDIADTRNSARENLRLIIAAYLLSATLKDVTLFVGINGPEMHMDVSRANHNHMQIVDLDAKRVSKLRRHAKNDMDVAMCVAPFGM